MLAWEFPNAVWRVLTRTRGRIYWLALLLLLTHRLPAQNAALTITTIAGRSSPDTLLPAIVQDIAVDSQDNLYVLSLSDRGAVLTQRSPGGRLSTYPSLNPPYLQSIAVCPDGQLVAYSRTTLS
jgi:hypothetical protein